jgi:hypothetical protein
MISVYVLISFKAELLLHRITPNDKAVLLFACLQRSLLAIQVKKEHWCSFK